MSSPEITTPESFAKEIENLVWKYDISYMDAVLHFVEQRGIEIESVTSLMKGNSALKSSIQEDAENLHFLPKTSRITDLF